MTTTKETKRERGEITTRVRDEPLVALQICFGREPGAGEAVVVPGVVEYLWVPVDYWDSDSGSLAAASRDQENTVRD